VGGRQRWVHPQAGFTSPRAANHLLTFGEFVACYLLAFADTLWPRDTGELAGLAEQASPQLGADARRRLRARIRDLDTARRALPRVRRVLANVPTYMVFDDHDVTDDWNLTRRWREDVACSAAGRRIVANALAAFWVFQGWATTPACSAQTSPARSKPTSAAMGTSTPRPAGSSRLCGALTAGASPRRPGRRPSAWTPEPSVATTATRAPPGWLARRALTGSPS
jgi:hypothetical protein